AILMGLPVLRHHDDRCLHRGDHVESEIQQDEWEWVERFASQKDSVGDHPGGKERQGNDDKFPAAAELSDFVRSMVREGKLGLLFLINIARNSMPQQVVGSTQTRSQRSK